MADVGIVYTFPNVTAEKWARLEADYAAKMGAPLTQNVSDVSAKGIKVHVDYEPLAETLTVQVLSRSWFDPSMDDINQQLRAWLEAELAS